MAVNCEMALDQMLESDVEDLTGESGTELAAHIVACERCQAVASEIVEGQRRLADSLRAMEAVRTVDVVLDEVRSQATRRRRRARAFGVLVPLAAAAALALLVTSDRSGTVPSDAVIPEIAIAVPPTLVRLPPATNAILLKTDNPKITVVWFY